MKNKKVIFIIIIIFIFLLTAIYFQNPKLVDRALYRIGIQEQVCFSENIVSNLEGTKNIAAVGDIGLTKNSLETLQSLNSVDPEIVLFLGDLSYTTAGEWIEFTDFLEKEKTIVNGRCRWVCDFIGLRCNRIARSFGLRCRWVSWCDRF